MNTISVYWRMQNKNCGTCKGIEELISLYLTVTRWFKAQISSRIIKGFGGFLNLLSK